jgi:hypothetical protein
VVLTFRADEGIVMQFLLPIGLSASNECRERQAVVVADDDMRLIDTVDVFDGEERERQHAAR